MKRYSNWVEGLLCLMLVMATSACGLVSSYDTPPYRHIFIEEEAHLTDDASSPFCDFSVDYTYLNEEGDSIAQLINRAIQREFLGEAFGTLTPEVAVDSFKNVYLRDYRKEIGGIYQAEKALKAPEEEMPAWFSQTYSMVTFVEEGQGGHINASANYFVDMGGAHPNQWSRWMNFDFATGRLLGKDEVFKPEAKAEIEAILLDKLLQQQAALYPDETLKTLEDLQAKGFLQLTPMYIPDNFLLAKDKVLFLFNRYDIAPYSAGEIVLEVPYGEIGHCLKQN
jgi:hypothetical protein